MSIYTGEGDKGKTDLFTEERVRKNHPRVELLGTIDEVNSLVGKAHTEAEKTAEDLEKIQEQLYRLQSSVASEGKVAEIDEEDIRWLEKTIDRTEEKLPELDSFIYQRGKRSAVELFHARTVCRRAERIAVKIQEEDKNLRYLNRLSDFLFVLGRHENQGYEKKVR